MHGKKISPSRLQAPLTADQSRPKLASWSVTATPGCVHFNLYYWLPGYVIFENYRPAEMWRELIDYPSSAHDGPFSPITCESLYSYLGPQTSIFNVSTVEPVLYNHKGFHIVCMQVSVISQGRC